MLNNVREWSDDTNDVDLKGLLLENENKMYCINELRDEHMMTDTVHDDWKYNSSSKLLYFRPVFLISFVFFMYMYCML